MTANKNSTLLDHFSLTTDDLLRRAAAEIAVPWELTSPFAIKLGSAKLVFRVLDRGRT